MPHSSQGDQNQDSGGAPRQVLVPVQPPRPPHLVVVALGEEQGAELPVQRCLVGLLPVLGQLVHVGLRQLERLLSQVVLAVPVPNVQQPWGMQRELLREAGETTACSSTRDLVGDTHMAGALPAQQNCPAWGQSHTTTGHRAVSARIFPAGDVTGFYLLMQLYISNAHSGVVPLCVIFHKIHSSQY